MRPVDFLGKRTGPLVSVPVLILIGIYGNICYNIRCISKDSEVRTEEETLLLKLERESQTLLPGLHESVNDSYET